MTIRRSPRFRRSSWFVRASAGVAVAAGLVASARDASAQEWLKDRRYQEGAGIRTGDFELHPGIAGEIGYDSNWLLRTHETRQPPFANADPREAGVLRLTPSLSVATLGPQRLEDGTIAPPPSLQFRGGADLTYREFIGVEEIRKQRNASGNAYVTFDVNSGRPIGFGVFANYRRLIQPSVVADPNLSFNRSDVRAGGELVLQPGSGTLDLRFGYQFYGALFEESNGVPFTNLTHDITVKNRWRFRPRTALFHDTSLRFITYPNSDRAVQQLNNSTPLRTRVGLNGLLTPRFGTLLAVGYGGSFYEGGTALSTQQYDSINGQAEGTFYLSGNPGSAEPGQVSLLLSSITLGFNRDFQNSLLGNFYTSNKGYGRVVYFFGGRALLQGDVFFEAMSFPPIFLNNGPGAPPTQAIGDFTNFRYGGTLFGEYRFTDSFGVNTTLDYVEVASDTVIPLGGPAGGPADFHMAYRRFQAFLGARFFL